MYVRSRSFRMSSDSHSDQLLSWHQKSHSRNPDVRSHANDLLGQNKNLAELTEKSGGMHFKAFSVVKTMTNDGTSIDLFTIADIKKYFPKANAHTCGIFCINGDGKASPEHFDGAVWLDNTLYVTFSSLIKAKTKIRLTGLLYYCDRDLIE